MILRCLLQNLHYFSMNTINEAAEDTIRSWQSSITLFRLSNALLPITLSISRFTGGFSNKSKSISWFILATSSLCAQISWSSVENLSFTGTSLNGSSLSLINLLKSNSQSWSSYSIL